MTPIHQPQLVLFELFCWRVMHRCLHNLVRCSIPPTPMYTTRYAQHTWQFHHKICTRHRQDTPWFPSAENNSPANWYKTEITKEGLMAVVGLESFCDFRGDGQKTTSTTTFAKVMPAALAWRTPEDANPYIGNTPLLYPILPTHPCPHSSFSQISTNTSVVGSFTICLQSFFYRKSTRLDSSSRNLVAKTHVVL